MGCCLYYWGSDIWACVLQISRSRLQNGMLFAGFIKLLFRAFAAFTLDAPLEKSDEAYPWLLSNLLPVGVKGLHLLLLRRRLSVPLWHRWWTIFPPFYNGYLSFYLRPKARQSELVHYRALGEFTRCWWRCTCSFTFRIGSRHFINIQNLQVWMSPSCIGNFSCRLLLSEISNPNGAFRRHWVHLCSLLYWKFFCPAFGWMDRINRLLVVLRSYYFLLGNRGQSWNNAPLFMLHYFLQVSCLIFFLHHHCHSDWFLLALVVKGMLTLFI